MRNILRKYGLYLVGVIGVVSILASQTVPPTTKLDPIFRNFEVSPSAICLRRGSDFIRVNFEIDLRDASALTTGGGDVCSYVFANGISVHPQSTSVNCYDRDGASGTVTFSVTDILGNNIPNTITVSGELTRSGYIGEDPFDIKSVEVEARICNVGDDDPIPIVPTP